jgi:hypothetical protein
MLERNSRTERKNLRASLLESPFSETTGADAVSGGTALNAAALIEFGEETTVFMA